MEGFRDIDGMRRVWDYCEMFLSFVMVYDFVYALKRSN